MELQSGRAAAFVRQMSAAGNRLSSMRLVLGQRDFLLLGQCGLSAAGNRRKLARNCRCDGVSGISSALSMDWRPAFDEVLLMSSVLLACVAGVVKPFAGFPGRKSSGVIAEKEEEVQTVINDNVWDDVVQKLTEAIRRISDTTGGVSSGPKLCLQALAYGPRLRLLLTSLSLLRNEATKGMSVADLCGMVGPVCRLWITQEMERKEKVSSGYFSNTLIKAEDLSGVVENEAREYMSTLLERSGKAKLYEEFLFYLSTRSETFFHEEGSLKLAGNVLEDIVIAVSDGAAALYLASVSAVNTGWPVLLHTSICSTRCLERFRNEVALQQWIHHNFDSVAAIYEDRLELWGLVVNVEKTEQETTPKRKPVTKDVEGDLYLNRLSVRFRRSRELKALTGWRYLYSLYMEFSDVVGPLLQILLIHS